MAVSFKPAKRENTPLIIGIAGPTKSGKTYSALRLAAGLANGRQVVMLNAEGARGHQYADKFSYVACDLKAPFRPTMYTEALREAAKLKPGAIIIDSVSHMHDGPGGVLEWHEEELDRMAGSDFKKRERVTFAAWVKPKAAENQFIYAMLDMPCALILAMRAKEKVKLIKGKDPVDLGWQPIVGERVAFETIFTLMLPPHSKGVPDLGISEMREPFDSMVPAERPIDEDLGRKLASWAVGGSAVVGSYEGSALKEKAEEVAKEGSIRIQEWWGSLTNAQRKTLEPYRAGLKAAAEAADKAKAEQAQAGPAVEPGAPDDCGCPDAPNGQHLLGCEYDKPSTAA